ncbi:hypothetical protein [Curtobacterium sp. Leaf261]|uniref:hypothetical protein n=1 Tax=Curtobacterium sp. Leaf261 TaxID=1736311 RepID=UPI0007015C3D|nr:hypothetical protein [Curtobacterium sp. Leaf261]KQO62725.1 hypothetical protein ASF23_07110 [Curtobacterium sp. Leaf261]
MHTITSRVLLSTAGAATAAALVFGAAGIANAAAPSPSASSRTTTGLPFRAVSAHAIRAQLGTVPTAMATDLTALRGKKDSDRRAAADAIETKALDGTYGADVKTIATAAQTAWKTATPTLRKDVKALHGASQSDRSKDLAALETKALSGGYGSAVESYAKRVKANVEKQQAAALGRIVGSAI